MSPLSPLRRLLLVLLALAQVGAPVLATAAHADLSRMAAGDVERVHVEDPGQQHAPPEHPESCVLCQLVGRAFAVPAEPAVPATARPSFAVQASEADRLVQRSTSASVLTRAPPGLV